MANVREMVNTHLPVALKLINSAALVAIALSTLCAAGSLREMSGRSAAPAAVTDGKRAPPLGLIRSLAPEDLAGFYLIKSGRIP